MKDLIELSTNRRHLKLSIVLLVQFLRSIPRPIRFQITDVTFFKPANQLDLVSIEQEYVNMTKQDFKALTRFVFINKHDFIFINKDDNYIIKNYEE